MNTFTTERNSYAICLIGHGTQDSEGNQDFLILGQKLREKKTCDIIQCGFLEFAKPTAAEA